MGFPTSSDKNLNEIIKSISEGEYRIPRFQRDFVWEIKKTAALIDSIFKGYPIGSIILWKTKQDLAEIRDFGNLSIPSLDTGRYTSYVIDGQQRLASLFFALNGLSNGDVDYSKICVSLVADSKEQIVYDAMPTGVSPDDFVVLKDLFSAKALLGKHAEKRLEYYQILLQYKISTIQIDDEILDLNDVIEIFERLNLGGKNLTLLTIISARSYIAPSIDEEGNEVVGFDLSRKFEDFNNTLEANNYGKISDSTFLQSISACILEKVNRAEILKNLEADKIKEEYSAIETAISAAIEHLKGDKYGVLVSNLLPYEPILVAFTFFHYKMGNTIPDAVQENNMVDYFWRCVLGKRYNKSTDTNLNSDITKIKKIVNHETVTQEPIILSPKYLFENGDYKIGSAFTKGMLCIMALESPKSLVAGRVINITNNAVSSKADKQLHHFFPQKCSAIQSNEEYKKNVDNVINIVFMDTLTNIQITNDNPSVYIPKLLDKNPELEDALSTHYICLNDFGIEDDDYIAFLNSRSRSFYDKLITLIISNAADSINDTTPFISADADTDDITETTTV